MFFWWGIIFKKLKSLHAYHKEIRFCLSCKEIKGKRGEKLNCNTCDRKCPAIARSNMKVWDLFTYAKWDHSSFTGEKTGLRIDSLIYVAQILRHDIDRATLNKLLFLERCELTYGKG